MNAWWQWVGALAGALAFLGVFPLSYVAYRAFASEMLQTRVNDDLRLLGLVREDDVRKDDVRKDDVRKDDLDGPTHGLPERAYSHWEFGVYISLVVLLSLAVLAGVIALGGRDTLFGRAITLVGFGYLGAYVFSVQDLVRRYNTFDLQPQVYSSMLVRMLLAMAIVLVAHVILPGIEIDEGSASAAGETASVTTSTLPASYINVLGWPSALAFLIGVFPSRGLAWLSDRAMKTLQYPGKDRALLPLGTLLGMSDWHETRLEQMGIDNAQNLASADLSEMILTTRFKTQQIVNWVDQAILYVKTRERYERFRAAGITTFHELRRRLDRVVFDPVPGHGPVPAGMDSVASAETVETLTALLGLSSPGELIYLSDYSNYPNYAHIAEYYLRTGHIARQRATAGMALLLRARTETDFSRAVDEYRSLLKHDPGNAQARANLGTALYKLGRFEEALRELSQAIELDGRLAEAYSNRADIYLRREEYEPAIRDATRAILLSRDNPDPYNYRGLARLVTNEIELAVEDFGVALDIDDRFAPAYLNRGIACNATGRFYEALWDFERAYLLGDRELFELWLGWGTALLGTQDYVAAIEKLSRAMLFDDHPQVAAAYAKRGYAYMQADDGQRLDRAESDLRHALKRDDKLLEAYDNLGALLVHRNNILEAIEYYSRSLKIDPRRAITYYNRSLAYYRNGDMQSACEDMQRVSGLAPKESVIAQEARTWLERLCSESEAERVSPSN